MMLAGCKYVQNRDVLILVKHIVLKKGKDFVYQYPGTDLYDHVAHMHEAAYFFCIIDELF